MTKWILRVGAVLVVLYGLLLGTVAWAMRQPPEIFGQVMRYLPAPVVWGLLPSTSLWLWAREGNLREGDPAPEFDLAAMDGSARVRLSSHAGKQPVVLVFGSYT